MSASRKARNTNGDYAVGYGRPPRERRFKKGESGNPGGRPKGIKSFGTALTEILQRKVTVTENGAPRRMRIQDVIVQRLVNKAAQGDHAAIRLLFTLVKPFEAGDERPAADAAPLSAEDQAIIERYLASLDSVGSANAPAASQQLRKRRRFRRNDGNPPDKGA